VPAPRGTCGDRAPRVRVALLVSPASFEGFYGIHLHLDRQRYVDEYRNDFVWNYTEALRSHGVDVITYVPAQEEEGRYEAADGFAVRFLRLPRGWRRLEPGFRLARTPVERYALETAQAGLLLRGLRRGIEADGIDVLYVQEYWTGRFDVLAYTSPVPVVAGEHGGSGGLHVHSFKRGALRRAAAITVQSTAERRRLQRYGCDAQLVTNGVDSRFFTPAPDVERCPRVLTVARLVDSQKRISDLISAISRLPSPWALDIIGSGPDEEQLREMAKRCGCVDRVAFHGWVGAREELREHYRSCGVFALPSVWEAVTLALLEAMACGAAPVVTPLRPFLDVIRDGENGLIVPRESPDRLADALRSAYADRRRLGAAARTTVEASYDRDATMGRLAAVLRRAAGDGARR
jgi:glycosyltransferase involved in cell wall biosynthesis